jgi:hypothetical protein
MTLQFHEVFTDLRPFMEDGSRISREGIRLGYARVKRGKH